MNCGRNWDYYREPGFEGNCAKLKLFLCEMMLGFVLVAPIGIWLLLG